MALWERNGGKEGVTTGVLALTSSAELIEWRDAEVFEDVCGGHWAAVSHAVAAERIKVQLTPSPPTGFKFQKQFGDAQLREAGFGSHMPFAKCVEVICNTLKGVKSMTATLTENDSGGIDLIIAVTMEYFAAEYKLSLDKVAIGASDKLSAELRVTKQLAAARIELEQMTTALRDSITEADTTSQQLATATKRIAELCSQLEKEKTESESRISEMKRAIEQMRAANEELRVEIHIRDKRIAVLQSASKPTGRIFTTPKDTLDQMETALRIKQQLAIASQRIAELSSHLDKESVETESRISEVKYEIPTETKSTKSTGSGLVVEVTLKPKVSQMIRASVKKHRAHYSHSYHPCNLLKYDDSDYASQMNADFGTDETDWVLFDCEAVYRRLSQITIRQRGAGSDVSQLKVQVTDDLANDSWFTARPSTVRPTNTEEMQTFELKGVDANFRYIRVVFEENYGCSKPRARRFVVNLLRFRGIPA